MRFSMALLVLAMSTSALAEDHIVVVVDTSGSMETYMRSARSSRINVAKEALSEVLSQLPETTEIGIISFNGWEYPLGKIDKVKLKASIDGMRTGGGTPLYEYMKAGATELLRARKSYHNNGTFKLLVVTDGEAGDDYLSRDVRDNDGNIENPGVLTDIISRGIAVDAIGLDMQSDHALSTKINGKYMRGDDNDSLKAAIKSAVAEANMSDPNDAQAAEEYFVLFRSLSDEFASGIIKTIGENQNQPIGEKPPGDPEFSAAVDATPTSVPASAPITPTSNGALFFACIGVGLLILILVVIASAIVR